MNVEPIRHDRGKCDIHAPVKLLTEDEKKRLTKQAIEFVERATIQLLIRQPFFGTLLCGLRKVPTWSLPTMAVDGVSLFYNPYFTVNTLKKAERRGVLCHEVLHLAYQHLARRKARLPKKFNAACDFAVNSTIKDEANIPLPDFCLYDKKYQGMSAEEIYRALPDKPNQKQNGKGDEGCPDCDENWDSWDGHLDNPDLDKDELRDRIVRAYEAAKKAGKLPAGIERAVKDLRTPRVDWREYIWGKAIDNLIKHDYFPEIRSLLSGVVAKSIGVKSTWVPGLGKEEARVLVIATDTSGSIDQTMLNAFAGEVKGVMEMAEKTILISCDCSIHEVVEVNKFSDLFRSFAFKGGGGTDFRPPFLKLEELGIVPDMLIYFTDGYGCFPEKAPEYPVLWAFTEEHQPAPWGDSVTINERE